MTRVEKSSQLENQVKNLTSQVQAVEKLEVKEHKSREGKFACCGLVLAIILFFGLWLTWLLAASGLITVPVVSSQAYKIPSPIHVVIPGISLEAYTTEYFNSFITERLQAGGGELKDREVTVFLPEDALTATLINYLKSNNLSFFAADKTQVAVQKDSGVEVFLPLVNSTNKNALRLVLKPTIENGQLSFVQARMFIGNLVLPDWLSSLILKPFLVQGWQYANSKMASYMTTNSIAVEDGRLKFDGTLTVQIKTLN